MAPGSCAERAPEASVVLFYRERQIALLGGVGGGLEGVADEHDVFPFVHEDGAKAIVEIDRRLIRVENFPAHAEVIFVPGDAGHVVEQSLADALLAKLRPDKDILRSEE